MKIISYLFLMFFTAAIYAKDVTFAWDYPASTNDVEFELFVVPADVLEWNEPIWKGNAKTASVFDLVETTRYRATVRAARGELKSPISNIIVFTPGSEPQIIEIPEPVKEIRIITK